MPRLTKEQQHQLNMATHLAFFLVGLALGALLIYIVMVNNGPVRVEPSNRGETSTSEPVESNYTVTVPSTYTKNSSGDAGISSDLYMKDGKTVLEVLVEGDGAIDTSKTLTETKFSLPNIEKTGSAKLDGENALIYTYGDTRGAHLMYVAKHHDSFYLLTFYDTTKLSSEQQTILDSFKFTN